MSDNQRFSKKLGLNRLSLHPSVPSGLSQYMADSVRARPLASTTTPIMQASSEADPQIIDHYHPWVDTPEQGTYSPSTLMSAGRIFDAST